MIDDYLFEISGTYGKNNSTIHKYLNKWFYTDLFI
jgi:hypothetical protein